MTRNPGRDVDPFVWFWSVIEQAHVAEGGIVVIKVLNFKALILSRRHRVTRRCLGGVNCIHLAARGRRTARPKRALA